VQSSIFIGFQQQLLNGFGAVNTRNIRIAKNNRKIADLAFAQQAITTTLTRSPLIGSLFTPAKT